MPFANKKEEEKKTNLAPLSTQEISMYYYIEVHLLCDQSFRGVQGRSRAFSGVHGRPTIPGPGG